MNVDTEMILRTKETEGLPERASIDEHKAIWETGECPSCGSAPCPPHPDFLICQECEEDWPCRPVALVANELNEQARSLYRRADNLPLTNDQQVRRLGDFRSLADKLAARARDLRGES